MTKFEARIINNVVMGNRSIICHNTKQTDKAVATLIAVSFFDFEIEDKTDEYGVFFQAVRSTKS